MRLGSVLFAAVAVGFIVVRVTSGGVWGASAYPTPDDAARGEGAVRELVASLPPGGDGVRRSCQGPLGLRAIERLTQRLLTPAESFDLKIHVINANDRTGLAYAVYGSSHVVLTQQLIDMAKNPEIFAAALAHEIGHILDRPGNPIRDAAVARMPTPSDGEAAMLAALSSEARDYLEREMRADAIGAHLLNEADINSRAMALWFSELAMAERARGFLPTDLKDSGHPSDAYRAAALWTLSQPGGSAMTDDEWRAVRRICAF